VHFLRPVRNMALAAREIAMSPFRIKCTLRSRRYRRLEASVPAYVLPDPFLFADGELLRDPGDWPTRRRLELLELFREHVYGRSPEDPNGLRFDIVESDNKALGGLATRKQVKVCLAGASASPAMILLMYLPNWLIRSRTKVGVFVGLNFLGNHTIHPDRAITVTSAWTPHVSDADGVGEDMLREYIHPDGL